MARVWVSWRGKGYGHGTASGGEGVGKQQLEGNYLMGEGN